MEFNRFLGLQWLVMYLMLTFSDIAEPLRDLRIIVPAIVKKGDDIQLICEYNLENDSLYSVKWYKGRREFYRFTPRESPALKLFMVSSVKVESSMSNATHLMLVGVQPSTSGKYSCEVSADAPSFHTAIESKVLEVVEIPLTPPTIVGVHSSYRVGDILQANCTSQNSKPAANLTWTINSVQPSFQYVRNLQITKDVETNLESSRIGIHFLVIPEHFRHGKLKIQCIATIRNIYNSSIEMTIDQDVPPAFIESPAPVGQVKSFQTFNDETSVYENHVGPQNDPFMTHIKADDVPSKQTVPQYFSWLVYAVNIIFLRLIL